MRLAPYICKGKEIREKRKKACDEGIWEKEGKQQRRATISGLGDGDHGYTMPESNSTEGLSEGGQKEVGSREGSEAFVVVGARC